jgi:hypothetical protein
VGTDLSPEGNRRFASACNTLHLIGSKGVLEALHHFQDEIRVSNSSRDDDRHDALLSNLVWEIREDLRIPNNPPRPIQSPSLVFRERYCIQMIILFMETSSSRAAYSAEVGKRDGKACRFLFFASVDTSRFPSPQ